MVYLDCQSYQPSANKVQLSAFYLQFESNSPLCQLFVLHEDAHEDAEDAHYVN